MRVLTLAKMYYISYILQWLFYSLVSFDSSPFFKLVLSWIKKKAVNTAEGFTKKKKRSVSES